jgi:hypothetical protein
MVNEVKKNNAPETIISLPVLRLQHKELGIKMEQFSDAPMHMLFLGVTKHLMAHVDRLFGGKKFEFLNIFAKSYQSTSNLAKISLSNGVLLLVLQKLSQYQPPVGNLLNTLPFHACRWFILDY